jgi:hypothetical protein
MLALNSHGSKQKVADTDSFTHHTTTILASPLKAFESPFHLFKAQLPKEKSCNLIEITFFIHFSG